MSNLSDHVHMLRAVGHGIGNQAEQRIPKEARPATTEESLVRAVLIDLSAAMLDAAADLEQQMRERLEIVGPIPAWPRE